MEDMIKRWSPGEAWKWERMLPHTPEHHVYMIEPPDAPTEMDTAHPPSKEDQMDSITSPKELDFSDMDPSAVGMNEPKETPPAVLHTSHPPNEIEVVEVTPPTEPSSTPVPYIAHQ